MLYDPKWAPPATEIKLEPWQEVLLKAADLIEECGLLQRALGGWNIGYCSVGAIRASTGMSLLTYASNNYALNYDAYARVIYKLANKIGGHMVSDEAKIIVWNDRPGRTKEEVIAKLRETAHAV